MMTLNIYKNQTEIEKTYEVEGYDIMLGTVEDCLGIMDDLGEDPSKDEIFKVITKNRVMLFSLLKDIFPGLTDEELRHIKLKELVPFFLSLFAYVQESFGNPKN